MQPLLRWKPYDAAKRIFDLVVFSGWPTKVATNRDDGAYNTKSLFGRHPDYPAKNAWRYYSRKADTIVLVNGEKASPLLVEFLANESPLASEAILYGSQKPHIGLFVAASNPSSTQYEIVEAVYRESKSRCSSSCSVVARHD